jgi:hypothetical protein
VNESLPANPLAGAYWKLPSLASESVPWVVVAFRTASAEPRRFTIVSLDRTPWDALTVVVVSAGTVYESFAARQRPIARAGAGADRRTTGARAAAMTPTPTRRITRPGDRASTA